MCGFIVLSQTGCISLCLFMPNYYKIPLKKYIYHVRHPTVNVCRVTVNCAISRVKFFSLFRYRDILQILYRYRIEIQKVISTRLYSEPLAKCNRVA